MFKNLKYLFKDIHYLSSLYINKQQKNLTTASLNSQKTLIKFKLQVF